MKLSKNIILSALITAAIAVFFTVQGCKKNSDASGSSGTGTLSLKMKSAG